MAWKCKNCGGENITRYVCGSFSGYEKDINKDLNGDIEFSEITEIDFFGSCECADCNDCSDEMTEIAEWVEDEGGNNE